MCVYISVLNVVGGSTFSQRAPAVPLCKFSQRPICTPPYSVLQPLPVLMHTFSYLVGRLSASTIAQLPKELLRELNRANSIICWKTISSERFFRFALFVLFFSFRLGCRVVVVAVVFVLVFRTDVFDLWDIARTCYQFLCFIGFLFPLEWPVIKFLFYYFL